MWNVRGLWIIELLSCCKINSLVNVKNDLDDLTGRETIYNKFGEFQIIFHVATMMPICPNDYQQVGRKRHIGNDVVVVIFVENNVKIDPSCFSSQFNRNYSNFLHSFMIFFFHVALRTFPSIRCICYCEKSDCR
jgi:hypothetical protein